TVPNKWSSTPWQTMNHPELNALRRDRLQTALPLVEQELGDILIGYVSENEPAYWAFEESDDAYPVKRKGLLADFNPHTVAAAKQDGVELNPIGGLSIEERLWLHQNVARYIQNTINIYGENGITKPVYSH